ncbi:MAG: polysaccharide deacetylase family protein, partial [Candidatus Hydrothermarchaeales archaeon]
TALFWPKKDERYVLFVFILFVYFALIFLSRFRKSHVLLFLLIALVFQGYSTYQLVEANTYQNILFEDAGHWLRDNTPEDARVLTQSNRQVNYFSHRMTFQPPKEVERVERFISYYNTSYAVVDTYEKVTPAYAYTYFDRYKLVKTFRRGEDEIRIYNLSHPSRITVILSFDFEMPGGVKNIPRIFQILKEHNANATFFVTGAIAKDYPEIVREIMEEGYEVGSHGYYHEFPIFEEGDAELFAEEFNTTFEYVWGRSAKSEENFEEILKRAREEIKNATGSYPSSYRSPILTPSITKDMRYIEIVEKAGFTIDSSLLRRYIEEGMVERTKDITIVPASFSDAEFSNEGFVMELAREHSIKEEPLVVVLHPWKFSKEGHMHNFKDFLDEIERRYSYVEYKSIEGHVVDRKG